MSDAPTVACIEATIATEGLAYGIQFSDDVTWELGPTGESVTVIIKPSIAKRLRAAVKPLFAKDRPRIIGSTVSGVPTSASFGLPTSAAGDPRPTPPTTFESCSTPPPPPEWPSRWGQG